MPLSERPRKSPCGAITSRYCNGCGKDMPKDQFSTYQWNNRAGGKIINRRTRPVWRRCKRCVAQKVKDVHFPMSRKAKECIAAETEALRTRTQRRYYCPKDHCLVPVSNSGTYLACRECSCVEDMRSSCLGVHNSRMISDV